jgi:hypothetical protein
MVVSKRAHVNVVAERRDAGQRYVYLQISNGLTFEWIHGTQVVRTKKYPELSSPMRTQFVITKDNPSMRDVKDACMNYANGVPY